jgi:hypothetical protein
MVLDLDAGLVTLSRCCRSWPRRSLGWRSYCSHCYARLVVMDMKC